MSNEEKEVGTDFKAKIFLVSGLLIVFGLIMFLFVRLSDTSVKDKNVNNQVSRTDKSHEEDYLTDYYQDKRYDSDGEDNYLENDPFAKVCEGVPKGAVMFGGTTCMY